MAACRAARAAALVVVLALLALLAGHGGGSSGTLLIALPALAALVAVAAREWRSWPVASVAVRSVGQLAALSLATALPMLAWVLVFARLGALDAFLGDTVFGLPGRVTWFVPLPRPTPEFALASGALLLLGFGAARIGTRRTSAVLALAAAALCAGLALARTEMAIRGIFESLGILYAVSWLAAFAGLWALGRPAAASRASSPAAVLVGFQATFGLLYLHPAADLGHVMMALPVVLPAAAFGLRSLLRSRAAVALVVTGVLVPTVPLGLLLSRRHCTQRPVPVRLARATGVAQFEPIYVSTAALIRFLSEGAMRGREIFVISNRQLIYFLAQRPSPLQPHEFIFYLVGFDAISDEDAREAVDATTLAERVERSGALVIDDDYGPAGERFRHAYPEVQRLLTDRYEVVKRIGKYRVWDQRTH